MRKSRRKIKEMFEPQTNSYRDICNAVHLFIKSADEIKKELWDLIFTALQDSPITPDEIRIGWRDTRIGWGDTRIKEDELVVEVSYHYKGDEGINIGKILHICNNQTSTFFEEMEDLFMPLTKKADAEAMFHSLTFGDCCLCESGDNRRAFWFKIVPFLDNVM